MAHDNQGNGVYCLMEECSRRRDRCLIYFAPERTAFRYGGGRSWSWPGLRNDRPPPYRKRALSPRNRCLVEPRRMIYRSKQQRACLLAALGFEALKRS